MQAGHTTAPQGSPPRLNNSFQKLLLEFAAAATQGIDSKSLIQMFLRSTREFFGVDGSYFWRVLAKDELVGVAAEGHMAEGFPGTALKADESAVAAESVRRRRTLYVNQPDPSRYPLAGQYQAQSIMAAPLLSSSIPPGPTSSMKILPQKRRFWLVIWAVFWKRAAWRSSRVSSIAVRKS